MTDIITAPRKTYNADDFVAVSKAWGYQASIDMRNGRPLSVGTISSYEFPKGLRACFSQLFVEQEHQRCGVLQRSLSIRLVTSVTDHYMIEPARQCHLRKGECLVFDAADDLHVTSNQKQGQCVAGLFINACPERIEDSELAERVSQRLRGIQVTSMRIPTHIAAFAATASISRDMDPIFRLRIEACVLELLAVVMGQTGNDGEQLAGLDAAAMRRVCEYIRAEPAADCSLHILANIACMSVSSLKRKFPMATGQSVFEFVRNFRLDRARTLIETGEQTVKQAAWAAGYAHASNFITAYRNKFGYSTRNRV